MLQSVLESVDQFDIALVFPAIAIVFLVESLLYEYCINAIDSTNNCKTLTMLVLLFLCPLFCYSVFCVF